MSVTLFHNPKCSTSRNALALIRERGMEPTVVDYLKHPPSRDTLQALVASSGQGANCWPTRPVRVIPMMEQLQYRAWAVLSTASVG